MNLDYFVGKRVCVCYRSNFYSSDILVICGIMKRISVDKTYIVHKPFMHYGSFVILDDNGKAYHGLGDKRILVDLISKVEEIRWCI